MSEWLECEVKGLYLHSVCPSRVFLYTDCGRPGSAAGFLQMDRFAFVISEADMTEAVALSQMAGRLLESRWDQRVVLYRRGEQQEAGLERLKNGIGMRLVSQMLIPVKNYALELDAGTVVTPQGEAGGEYLQLTGSFGFYCQGRGCFFGNELRIELEGGVAGCFRFCIGGIKSLAELGVFLCYTREQKAQAHGRWVEAVRFQPFESELRPISLDVVMDVLRPEEEVRTYFCLPAGGYSSGFVNAFGENPRLTVEKPGDVFLVFSRERLYRENLCCRYHLSPKGVFLLMDRGDLLLGGNGMEYIRYQKGDKLYFQSGGPAHFCSRDERRLGREAIGNGTTSYLRTDGLYYSQGQDSAFFSESSGSYMDFAEIPLAVLDSQSYLPILPMSISDGLLREGEENAGIFDNELLAPERNRAMMRASVPNADNAECRTAVSEKGLAITYAMGEDFFRTLEISDKFRFRNLRGALRRAFLSSQPFLVLCGKDPVAVYAEYVKEESPLNVGGWIFDFTPENWSEDTLLILKYTSERSVEELCEDSGAFSWPLDLKEVEKAQNLIRKVLSGIQVKSRGDRRDFCLTADEHNEARRENDTQDVLEQILRDPQWCGAVLINMPLSTACLPGELAFLVSAGMPVQFSLNYMVFEKRAADEEGRLLPAPVSGLVFYEDYNYKAPNAQYEFLYRLNQIHAVIDNSNLADFQCKLSIAFNYVLDSPLFAVDSDTGNYISISGGINRLPDSEGVSRYHFELDHPVDYQVRGSAINRMTITGASLAVSDSGGLLFSFSGGLGFSCYERDIFSYGEDEKGENGFGLAGFSGFEVMACGNNYVKNMNHIVFYMGDILPRPNSLADCFEMSFERILTSTVSPETMGFEGIYVEGLSQKELDGAWAGLICRLDLGGMGALSNSAGVTLALLFAWVPGKIEKEYDGSVRSGPPDLYVGLRFGAFPGFSAKLPLEGVFSLGFEAVELRWDAQTESLYFVLRDFALKVLKLSFPEGGNRIMIFGNKNEPGKTAWYGAYERGERREHI